MVRDNGIYPCVFIKYNGISWDVVHGHGFTANKKHVFIRNEFCGRANVKHNKRIINGKSTRKKTGE